MKKRGRKGEKSTKIELEGREESKRYLRYDNESPSDMR
jgi:hypothetical protein